MSDVFNPSFDAPIYLSILAAVLPAVFWMIYIYRKDKLEREPLSLLGLLIFGGILSTALALILEIASTPLDTMFFSVLKNSPLIAITLSAMLVGVIEELSKYFFLKKLSWNNHNFNYTFDGLVYAVFVSLGFALAENIMYVFNYGLSVAVSRALLTIPAHMTFGAFMGADYGLAKIYAAMNEKEISKRYLVKGVVTAILLHAIYHALAMSSFNATSMIMFFGFVIVMDILVISLIKRRSTNDKSIRDIINEQFYIDSEPNLNGEESENSVK